MSRYYLKIENETTESVDKFTQLTKQQIKQILRWYFCFYAGDTILTRVNDELILTDVEGEIVNWGF